MKLVTLTSHNVSESSSKYFIEIHRFCLSNDKEILKNALLNEIGYVKFFRVIIK